MSDRPAPGTPDRSDPADDRLCSQLRALQPPAAAIEALGSRVLTQWSERPGGAAEAAQNLGGGMGTASVLGLHTSRRRLWAGLTTGLIAFAVVTTVVWLQRPDPTLDELMQADVLSQMAIGEM